MPESLESALGHDADLLHLSKTAHPGAHAALPWYARWTARVFSRLHEQLLPAIQAVEIFRGCIYIVTS